MELNAHLYSTRGWAFREESDSTPAVSKIDYLNFQDIRQLKSWVIHKIIVATQISTKNTEIVVALYAITGDLFEH
jgi:hypothetical protein